MILSQSPLEYNSNVIFSKKELIERATYEGCPIIVFPEKKPNDGSFLNEFASIEIPERNHILCIENTGKTNPNFVHGNGGLHLLDMMDRFLGRMRVKILVNTESPRDQNQLRDLMKSILDIP